MLASLGFGRAGIGLPASAAVAFATIVWLTCLGPARCQDCLDEHDPEANYPAMSRRIDELLSEKWQQAGIDPPEQASDAVFLRRAFLDLVGVIPSVGEARAFYRNDSPSKRADLIDRLLVDPRHATRLADTWQRELMLESEMPQNFYGTVGLRQWLRDRFVENVSYDRFVTDLLSDGEFSQQSSPLMFYQAVGFKPEKLATSTSRMFLGVQIGCAECHGHPFDQWSRSDFWSFAAFFAGTSQAGGSRPGTIKLSQQSGAQLSIPDTDKTVKARFLGASSEYSAGLTPRVALAQWITAAENPYFAKATVNRVWFMMFGRGLIDPVDNLAFPASHPQLLEELADYFIATGYDLRELFLVIAKSKAYGATSRVTAGDDEPQLFSRMTVKSLTAEQLYDSLIQAVGRPAAGNGQQQVVLGVGQFDQSRVAFVSKFQAPSHDPTEYQSGIPQALAMMNGDLTGGATDLERSSLLVSLEAPFFDDVERVETLFLATLSRAPTKEEREALLEYVETGGATEDSRDALADVLWALLNSAEFAFNH